MKKTEIEELEKQAEKGDILALYNLGEIYYYGDGIKRDYIKAFSYYEKAAKSGNAIAQDRLGYYYTNGIQPVKKDEESANKWYEKAAKQNHSGSQFMLGLFYSRSLYEHEKAFQWFSKAANLNHPAAQFYLANMYWDGEGCEPDRKTALKWYEKAAENGDENAQDKLGDIYYTGEEVEQNYEKALFWYEKAAERGNIEAKVNQADMYYWGEGCNENNEKAFYLYNDTKFENHWSAYQLGRMYELGYGTENDIYEAIKWYEQSASKDFAPAQFRLGQLYHHGRGWSVSQNFQLAKSYYEKAIANGYKDDKKEFDKLKKEMETYFSIEGTVTNYSINKTFIFVDSSDGNSSEKKDDMNFSFCITGSDGYSIKFDDKKMNLFRSKSNKLKIQENYTVNNDVKFTVSREFESILTQASINNKKIRFVISKTELLALLENDSHELTDISITLLSE